MFDLHTIILLRDRWENIYRQDILKWRVLFSDLSLPDELLDSWHAELARTDINIGAAYVVGIDQVPQVAVQLAEEPFQQFMGHSCGIEDGERVYKMIVDESVTITMYSESAELIRAIHVLIRGIMFSNGEFFTKSGYSGPHYVGGGDLSPEEAMLPERTGIFARTQEWTVRSEPQIKGVPVGASDATKLLVAPEDCVIGGIRGGVSVID